MDPPFDVSRDEFLMGGKGQITGEMRHTPRRRRRRPNGPTMSYFSDAFSLRGGIVRIRSSRRGN